MSVWCMPGYLFLSPTCLFPSWLNSCGSSYSKLDFPRFGLTQLWRRGSVRFVSTASRYLRTDRPFCGKPRPNVVSCTKFRCLCHLLQGPVETQFGTHLIYVESCNKPENTWKKLYDDIVDKVTGKEEEDKSN